MTSLAKWLIILRAYAFPATFVPMLIGSIIAYKYGNFKWLDFALTLIATFFLHSGLNLANTYFDYKNGVDRKGADDIGIVENLISPARAIKISLIFFSVSALIGLFIVFKNNVFQLLILGVFGFAIAWFYTAPKLAYKYRGAGEFGVFLGCGPLIVTGTALIQTGKILSDAIIASIPIGLVIVGLLVANNIRDRERDEDSKIKTLVHILGIEKSIYLYYIVILLPFGISCVFLNFSFSSLILLPSVLFAVRLIAIAKNGKFVELVRETPKQIAMFGILFSLSIYFRS